MAWYEIGILFDMKRMSPRRYAAEAWDVFVRNCSPERLKDVELFVGETPASQPGQGKNFCVAVRSSDFARLEYLLETFEQIDAGILVAGKRRFVKGDVVIKYRLEHRGRVDSDGRFVTPNWSLMDHELCLAAEWPYFPHTRPPWLTEAQNRQLEIMAEAGFKAPETSKKKSASSLRLAKTRRAGSKVVAIVRSVVLCAIIVAAVAAAGMVWMNRERYGALYHDKMETRRMQRILGVEGYAKRQEGFAMVNILQVPPELRLEELNERFAGKGYYVLQCDDRSLTDSSMDCSIWFSENQAGTTLVTQAFISINMRDKKDTPIWTELATGTVKLQQPGAEPDRGRRESLLAAVDGLSLTDLPDGRVLKHYHQKGRVDVVQQRRQEVARDKLRAQIVDYLSKRWIMSHRLHMASGSKLDGIVLEQKRKLLTVKTSTGKMRVPADRVASVETLDGEQLSEQINRALGPLKKNFTEDWQHQVCEEIVGELTERLATYGPAFPEACVIGLKQNDETAKLEAVVRIDGTEQVVNKDDRIADFKVIGMDTETNSILIRMGEGGEVLRIWPEPTPETG